MKNSFMKLNHVSTFSGKGQVEICIKEAGPLLTLPLNSIPIYRTSLGRQGVGNLYFA